MLEKERLWTKDFILVSLMNFFICVVFYLLTVIMSGYAITELGATTSQGGLVSSIFIVGVLLGRLFMGRVVDRIDYRKVLFIWLILNALSSGLYFIGWNIAFVSVARITHGVMLGVAITIITTIVANLIPASRKGEGIGYFSMSTILAAAFGPFIGILLVQYSSFTIVFLFCVILSFVSFILAFFVTIPRPNVKAKKAVDSIFSWKSYIEPRALPISMVILVIAFCYSTVLTYIHFYAQSLNLVGVASFFFITYAITILLSRPFTGKLLDQKGPHYVMYPTILIFAIGMFTLSATSNGFMLLLASALIGLGYGNIQSCSQAVAIKSVPTHKMGLANSTFAIFLDIGLVIGPYMFGLFLGAFTYSHLYGMVGVIILLCFSLYTLLFRKRQQQFGYQTREQM